MPDFVLPEALKAALADVAVEQGRNALRPDTVEHAVALLDRLPPSAIVRADSEIALSADLFHLPGVPPWRRLRFQPVDLPAWPLADHLYLFHRSGFLREAALKRLGGPLRSPFFFAAIAWRLNDWVVEVRRAAEACARRTFPLTDPAIVAEAAFFLFDRPETWLRWGEEARLVDEAVARPAVVDLMAGRMAAATTGPMASILRRLLRRPGWDDRLPTLAADAVLPPVRAVALRTLIEGRATWHAGYERKWVDRSHGVSRRVAILAERPVDRPLAIEALVEQAARDRSAAVRRIAADALIRHRAALANYGAMVERLADDRSEAVRGKIRFLADA